MSFDLGRMYTRFSFTLYHDLVSEFDAWRTMSYGSTAMEHSQCIKLNITTASSKALDTATLSLFIVSLSVHVENTKKVQFEYVIKTMKNEGIQHAAYDHWLII